MAERLREWPHQYVRGASREPCGYFWQAWLDGSVWALEPGADFDVSVRRIRDRAIAAARIRGLSLRVRWYGRIDRLVLQASPRRT
jgi:hypothetical protein